MIRKIKLKSNNCKKRNKLWISKLGKGEMELDSTKKYLSLREVMHNSGGLWLKEGGFRTKTYGLLIMILSGLLRYVISIIWLSSIAKGLIISITTIISRASMESPDDCVLFLWDSELILINFIRNVLT